MLKKLLFITVLALAFSCRQSEKKNLSSKEKSSGTETSVGSLNEKKYCSEGGSGVGGFDPVSYFSGSPVKGLEEFRFEYEGISYLFSSAGNLEKFKAEPEKYLPQYGGWCAMAMALGKTNVPSYDNFKIEEGKLYIFETTLFTNGKVLWETNPSEHKMQADDNYNKL